MLGKHSELQPQPRVDFRWCNQTSCLCLGPDSCVPLILDETSQPPNGSWPLSQNGSEAEAALAASPIFSSYYQHSSPVAAMFIVAYALIFLLCMVGNTLVCFTVLRNRHMRTVTNMFILNLAVSDLLVGIFCMPTTLVDNLITGKYAGSPSPFTSAFQRKTGRPKQTLGRRRSLSWPLGQSAVVSS